MINPRAQTPKRCRRSAYHLCQFTRRSGYQHCESLSVALRRQYSRCFAERVSTISLYSASLGRFSASKGAWAHSRRMAHLTNFIHRLLGDKWLHRLPNGRQPGGPGPGGTSSGSSSASAHWLHHWLHPQKTAGSRQFRQRATHIICVGPSRQRVIGKVAIP